MKKASNSEFREHMMERAEDNLPPHRLITIPFKAFLYTGACVSISHCLLYRLPQTATGSFYPAVLAGGRFQTSGISAETSQYLPRPHPHSGKFKSPIQLSQQISPFDRNESFAACMIDVFVECCLTLVFSNSSTKAAAPSERPVEVIDNDPELTRVNLESKMKLEAMLRSGDITQEDFDDHSDDSEVDPGKDARSDQGPASRDHSPCSVHGGSNDGASNNTEDEDLR